VSVQVARAPAAGPSQADVIERIAAGADARDEAAAFPHDAIGELAGAGLLGVKLPAEGQPIEFADELRLVRDVSRADGSVGRILDGHFNAVERLTLACPDTLAADELAELACGALLLGVWGADPGPGEGEPAELRSDNGVLRLHGVKTFCSGAGGVQRALVVARDETGQRRLVYVDVSGDDVSIDRDWFRGAGLRASESHRVTFAGLPVRAVLGGPGEMLREPWFSRDAIRTTATWAGIATSVVTAAFSLIRERGEVGELVALSAGRMRVALTTIERWLRYAGDVAETQSPLAGAAIETRWAIAEACREISEQAALACGSRPLAVGGALSRGRRDLDLFLLQHRLEPLLVRHGADALAEGRST
jgi:alkylation response protein AidB-like acyl-CoA dehydrogenase